MQKLKLVSVLFAALLLVGAGCAKQPNKADENKPAAKDVAGTTKTETVEKKTNSGIMITKAEAKGNKTLLVEFDVADEAKKDAEGYRLILSVNEKPTWPTQGTWYELGASHMSKEWKGLPLGKRFLRACVVKKDICEIYSDVLEVEVR